jgi:hypothetical protein
MNIELGYYKRKLPIENDSDAIKVYRSFFDGVDYIFFTVNGDESEPIKMKQDYLKEHYYHITEKEYKQYAIKKALKDTPVGFIGYINEKIKKTLDNASKSFVTGNGHK